MIFSIIIPAYNAGKTIKKCLDSIVKQDFTDFETIIVNDCSIDNTEEIINQYRVRQIILEKNQGPAAARNIGIKEAKGDILIFIDSDVAFRDANALSKLAKVFQERKDIDGAIMIKDKVPLNQGIIPLYWAYYKYYLWNQPGEFQTSFTTERSVVKRYVFDKVGLFNEKYKKADVEDFELGYKMNEQGYKLLIVRDIKVLHHFETFRQSVKKITKRAWQWIRLFLKRKKFDSVYSTKERGIKTLIAATVLPLLILSFLPYVLYLFLLSLIIYLFYSFSFFLFLVKEKKIHLIPIFLFLDLFFCFLTGLGAGFSIILYPLRKNE